MSIHLLLLILAGLIAYFAYNRLAANARLKQTLDEATDRALFMSPFRCAKIVACDNPCKQALALSKPILLTDLPKLPLDQCNQAKCDCKFVQLEDRRTGVDRRDSQILDSKRALAYANKRYIKDRRRASIKLLMLPQHQF